jgi:hypothetical protein
VEFFTSEVTKIEALQGTSGWTIERKEETWRAKDSDELLDAGRVETFLNTLADLRLSEFVEEHPQDLARYGLEPTAGAISVWTTHQDAPQRLLVGNTMEGSADRYGRIEGREAVVRLPEAITGLISKTVDQFRPPPAPASVTPPQQSPQSPPAGQ